MESLFKQNMCELLVNSATDIIFNVKLWLIKSNLTHVRYSLLFLYLLLSLPALIVGQHIEICSRGVKKETPSINQSSSSFIDQYW